RWVESPLWFFFWYGLMGGIAAALVHLPMWEAVTLKWFSRRRARALLWISVGEASGPMIFPLLITLFISAFGWREAWLWYGVVTIAVLLPFTLVLRTRPEQAGQRLDGEPLPSVPAPSPTPEGGPDAALRATGESARPTEANLSRNQALRTRTFWLVATGFTLTGFGVTGFQSQWIPHFQDVGFSLNMAAAAVSVYGAANIASRVLWGSLASRFPIRPLLTAHTLAAAAGVLLLLTLVTNPVMLFVWAAYQGLVLGSYFQLHTLLSAEYFGRLNIGAVRGAMFPLASTTRGTGALVLGAMRDWQGSYALAFVVVLGTWVANAVLIGVSRKPRAK
ncbi:MAG: MFS transporter, partial [Dehalococcoidia bacterium]